MQLKVIVVSLIYKSQSACKNILGEELQTFSKKLHPMVYASQKSQITPLDQL